MGDGAAGEGAAAGSAAAAPQASPAVRWQAPARKPVSGGAPVLRKARAETTSGDAGQLSDAPAGIEGAHTPAPNGGGDLSALVHQLYGMIKRELKVERERKGGIY